MRRRAAVLGVVLVLPAAGCGGEPAAAPPASAPVLAPPAAPTAPDAAAAGTSAGSALDAMVMAPGAELVLQNCISCHGPRQFLQQRGDRDTWLGLIRWMQRDHGLWPLLPEVEERIVGYLATHYGPEPRGRRRAIPPDLMPPNPFAVEAATAGR